VIIFSTTKEVAKINMAGDLPGGPENTGIPLEAK
jgi:hypothetical protein